MAYYFSYRAFNEKLGDAKSFKVTRGAELSGQVESKAGTSGTLFGEVASSVQENQNRSVQTPLMPGWL